MAFTEDLSVFFNAAEFAVNATLNGVAVRGIPDNTPAETLSVDGTAPRFTLATASVPAEPRGLVLAVTGGASYTVRNYQHDGTGVTSLVLEAV